MAAGVRHSRSVCSSGVSFSHALIIIGMSFAVSSGHSDAHSSWRSAMACIAARQSGDEHCSSSFASTPAHAEAIAARVSSQLPAGAPAATGALRCLLFRFRLLLRDSEGDAASRAASSRATSQRDDPARPIAGSLVLGFSTARPTSLSPLDPG